MIDMHVGAVLGGGVVEEVEKVVVRQRRGVPPQINMHTVSCIASHWFLVRNDREEFCLGSIGADERPQHSKQWYKLEGQEGYYMFHCKRWYDLKGQEEGFFMSHCKRWCTS
jgi:hypothetical protein